MMNETYLLSPSQPTAITKVPLAARSASPLRRHPRVAVGAIFFKISHALPPLTFLLATK